MTKPFIIYDDQIFSQQKFGGISRYFCEIIKRIQMEYDISVRYSNNYYLKKYKLGKHQRPIPECLFTHYQDSFSRKNLRFSRKVLSSDLPYLFHPTYYDPYFLDVIGNNPFVVTVHDMIYEKLPDYLPNSEWIIQQKKEVITKATRVIAISEKTKQDIIELLNISPEKIDVIYHATSMNPSSEHNLKLPDKYLLFVGDRSSYKNFNRFMMAFAELYKKDNQLFVICTGKPFNANETNLFRQLNLENQMIQFSASDQTMCELYKRAEAFVFPSIYEGFGIPILEAFASSCPIALSNTSCFPEIAGNAGAYFDPYSIDSIVQTLETVIHDTNERERLIKAGKERLALYSWENATLQTEAVYQKAIEPYT